LASSTARALVFHGIGALAAAMICLVSFHLVDLRMAHGFSPLEEGLALSVITLTQLEQFGIDSGHSGNGKPLQLPGFPTSMPGPENMP